MNHLIHCYSATPLFCNTVSMIQRQPGVRTLSVQWGIESSAGSFGYGNDLVEALITAQRIPARIKAQIAVGWARRDLRDNFPLSLEMLQEF